MVQQAADPEVNAAEPSQHTPHLRASQHDRQSVRRLRRRDPGKPRKLDAEHVPVQEQERALRLVLRRRRDVAVHCELRQKGLHFLRGELRWMALAVKPDEASNPIDIRLLGAEAVMPDTDDVSDAIEQTRWGRGVHQVVYLGPTIGLLTVESPGFSTLFK